MMHVMLDNMPDNPLTCKVFYFSTIMFPLKNVVKIVRGPASEGIMNQLPACVQARDQFGGASNGGAGHVPISQV